MTDISVYLLPVYNFMSTTRMLAINELNSQRDVRPMLCIFDRGNSNVFPLPETCSRRRKIVIVPLF